LKFKRLQKLQFPALAETEGVWWVKGVCPQLYQTSVPSYIKLPQLIPSYIKLPQLKTLPYENTNDCFKSTHIFVFLFEQRQVHFVIVGTGPQTLDNSKRNSPVFDRFMNLPNDANAKSLSLFHCVNIYLSSHVVASL